MRLSHKNMIQLYDLLRELADEENHVDLTVQEIIDSAKANLDLVLYRRQLLDAMGSMSLTCNQAARARNSAKIEQLQMSVNALSAQVDTNTRAIDKLWNHLYEVTGP